MLKKVYISILNFFGVFHKDQIRFYLSNYTELAEMQKTAYRDEILIVRKKLERMGLS